MSGGPSMPSPWRRRLLLSGWLLLSGVVCARAVQVQVVQAPEWRALAEAQHRTNEQIAAPRGTILDRDGTPLAVSRESFRVAVAGREVRDPEHVSRLLVEALDVSPRVAGELVASDRAWRVVPGSFPATVQESLASVRGVYLERTLERYHPHGPLARGLLGRVLDGRGSGGIEQSFDTVLRGREGSAVVPRDHAGRPLPGESWTVEPPGTGGRVVLTLDMDLQEIAREALEEAVERTGARGGDVLVTDPRTGEVLALVSLREGAAASLSAIHTPYEPGSTLKPFTVAGLLREGLVGLSDTVDVGDGTWRTEGRVLHDVDAEGRMTVAEALRRSSNVGIAKVAAHLEPGQQYRSLRDFGFGVPTGVPVAGEAAGTLRRPDRWSAQSPASLAIGYEIGVTPLQMAMAFGALANGGLLMEPRLVREVVDADGRVVERFEPRAVRRVVSPGVARAVSAVLVDVVEDGTGTSARLGTFRVAGKSGTTKVYSAAGGYETGAYFSSFVGFFPAEDPQLLVYVKLERPQGDYYGGAVAAPVTRATMEAALAARATTLDRAALLRSVRTPASNPGVAPARFAARPLDPPAPPTRAEETGSVVGARILLPDVRGLPARVAVRRLHAAGVRVAVAGAGTIAGTLPGAGAYVLVGDTVRLVIRGATDG